MAMVVAICEGGPLHGAVLSVAVDAGGQPGPLMSRQEVCGSLYGLTVRLTPAEATDAGYNPADELGWGESGDHAEVWQYEVVS